eukprot:TRINITY_DN2051_c0_g1_i6.p1 TRINITY_DN2051_c0_g1~~TRINITY_DN2051_c0_g1_i6.p1  ORF type:complete len:111 (+),score=1.13 TRINITY_DN2051_c0_g1_i6:278-610(+)
MTQIISLHLNYLVHIQTLVYIIHKCFACPQIQFTVAQLFQLVIFVPAEKGKNKEGKSTISPTGKVVLIHWWDAGHISNHCNLTPVICKVALASGSLTIPLGSINWCDQDN